MNHNSEKYFKFLILNAYQDNGNNNYFYWDKLWGYDGSAVDQITEFGVWKR